MDIKKQYEHLGKKYTLPGFGELDYEFSISSIDDDSFLLREIINKIREKIQTYINILDGILQPDTNSFSSIHEFRFFDDKDKKEIYNIFRKLMHIYRSSYLVEIQDGEKDLAELINDSFVRWTDLKKPLAKFIEKMKQSWENDVDIKEELGYLG